MTKKASSIRVGHRYRPSRVDEHYDAIIIGSGPSGLSASACLSQMGKKVACLEQHYTAGGFTHAYERAGFEWDVGVHFMNDVATPGTFPRKLFDFISEERIKWRAMGEEKILLNIGDNPQRILTMQAEKDKATLTALFPNESTAINQIYAHSMKLINRAMPIMLMVRLCGGGVIGSMLAKSLTKLLPKDLLRPCNDVLRRFTSNKHLIAMLSTTWVASGTPPDRVSYLMVAGTHVNNNPMGFPIGGSREIAKSIIPVIQKSGGELFTYAKVEEVLISNGKALGVRMADGHEIRSDVVISTAGVNNTFKHLVPTKVAEGCGYLQKLGELSRSVAHFNLFVGFDGSNEDLGLTDAEHFIFPSEDYGVDARAFDADLNAPLPFLYVTFASAKDSTWAERYPGKSTASIFFYTDNFKHFAKWRHETWEQRGVEYDEMKKKISNRVLETLFTQYPHLRERVAYTELSTPLSTRHFCMYERGEIYGLVHDERRLQQSWLRPATAIKNLFLAGQDTLLLGHTTGVMSGALAAANVLGLKQALSLMKRIRNA